MILSEITDHLENIAPLRFQEDYDNSGLLVGNQDATVTGAIIALDCTNEVVREALALGCNMVIAHHPIIFSGIKKFDQGFYGHKAIITAIKNDIILYAIHTNLDNVLRNGVNSKIGEKLGLLGIQTLVRKKEDLLEADYVVGAGIVGNLADTMDEESFLTHIRQTMKCNLIKHTAYRSKPVKRVAVCGGSGSFLLQEAINQKIDVFISSDFKYHQYFDANGQILIADIGHYESEYFTIELLFELIKKKFPKFAAHCTKVVTNPVRYF